MILSQATFTLENSSVRAMHIDPAALLNTKAVAKLLSFSEIYLKVLRCSGTGPKFIRFGRAIRYRHIDIMVWLAEHALKTSRCVTGTNKPASKTNTFTSRTNG